MILNIGEPLVKSRPLYRATRILIESRGAAGASIASCQSRFVMLD